jgi:hypothetical protein
MIGKHFGYEEVYLQRFIRGALPGQLTQEPQKFRVAFFPGFVLVISGVFSQDVVKSSSALFDSPCSAQVL